ncbi:YceD family protein [Wenyingzhuangia sp. IMCC45467]
MKTLSEFRIPFVGLKEGKHQFDFQIDRKFFDAFGYDEFEEVDFNVGLELNKKTTLLELSFVANGTVKVPCDVTGEDFNLEVNGNLSLIVKFGEAYNDENEELLILPHEAYQIEVQQYIYELIVLSVPQKRVKPGISRMEIKGEEEVDKQLKKKEEKKEQNDPRWDQLKQLLDKK